VSHNLSLSLPAVRATTSKQEVQMTGRSIVAGLLYCLVAGIALAIPVCVAGTVGAVVRRFRSRDRIGPATRAVTKVALGART
jgi:uncharacterized membrane protein